MVDSKSIEAPATTIAIIGPTASGKSALALAIAERHPCEIISMDSALVYCGMDIGSAKPSVRERSVTPHHLIDILDPSQCYSAAQFCSDAHRLIESVHRRGKIALIVGGTMLYLKAFLEGLDAMPAANAKLRLDIEQQAREKGWPALHAELAAQDPTTAARLSVNDSQRIQRALEVLYASGLPLSYFQKRIAAGASGTPAPAPSFPIISLEPSSRAWLHERIAHRFDSMLSQGFLHEVMRLRDRGDLGLQLPSVRCVGYRQAWEALDGHFPIQQWPERAIAATRQLAKRQITWQRSMRAPLFRKHVVAAEEPDAISQATQMALNLIQGKSASAIRARMACERDVKYTD